MNLLEFFDKYNIPHDGKKVCCPFHDDRSPSAIINTWGIYCYSCIRAYKISDLEKKFGVHIDREAVIFEKEVKGVNPLFIL
jgi:hypothetical protein